MTASDTETVDHLSEAGEELLRSLRALATELPVAVWDAHASVVQAYLAAVERAFA